VLGGHHRSLVGRTLSDPGELERIEKGWENLKEAVSANKEI